MSRHCVTVRCVTGCTGSVRVLERAARLYIDSAVPVMLAQVAQCSLPCRALGSIRGMRCLSALSYLDDDSLVVSAPL